MSDNPFAAVSAGALARADALLERNPWCRILKVVLLEEGVHGWDCIALFDKLFCDLRGMRTMSYLDVDDIDAYLESLADAPPTVVIGSYPGTVPTHLPPLDPASLEYRRQRGLMALPRLYRFVRDRGGLLFWDAGDPWRRIHSEDFYAQVRAYEVSGLLVSNRPAIDLIGEQLKKRGIDCVKALIYKPLGFNPSVHRDYGLPKTVNFAVTGRTNEEFRRRINRFCRVANYLSLGTMGLKRVRVRTAVEYAQALNRSRFSFAAHQTNSVVDGRFVGHTFSKYLEIPACRCLMVAQETSDMEFLGFREGEHFIGITPRNYKAAISRLWWDRKKAYVEEITDRGYQLLHARHTNQQRIEALVGDVVRAAGAQTGHRPAVDAVDAGSHVAHG